MRKSEVRRFSQTDSQDGHSQNGSRIDIQTARRSYRHAHIDRQSGDDILNEIPTIDVPQNRKSGAYPSVENSNISHQIFS